MCEYSLREERAFSNMKLAIQMKEQFERVSINSHKSFLPHLAVYKVRVHAHLQACFDRIGLVTDADKDLNYVPDGD